MIAYIAVPALIVVWMIASYIVCSWIARSGRAGARPVVDMVARQRVNAYGLRRSSGYWTRPEDAD
jgi:hypothetical protein